MATSSIFHTVKISDPEQAEAFVAALEASGSDLRDRKNDSAHVVTADPAVIRKLHEMNEKIRERKK